MNGPLQSQVNFHALWKKQVAQPLWGKGATRMAVRPLRDTTGRNLEILETEQVAHTTSKHALPQSTAKKDHGALSVEPTPRIITATVSTQTPVRRRSCHTEDLKNDIDDTNGKGPSEVKIEQLRFQAARRQVEPSSIEIHFSDSDVGNSKAAMIVHSSGKSEPEHNKSEGFQSYEHFNPMRRGDTSDTVETALATTYQNSKIESQIQTEYKPSPETTIVTQHSSPQHHAQGDGKADGSSKGDRGIPSVAALKAPVSDGGQTNERALAANHRHAAAATFLEICKDLPPPPTFTSQYKTSRKVRIVQQLNDFRPQIAKVEVQTERGESQSSAAKENCNMDQWQDSDADECQRLPKSPITLLRDQNDRWWEDFLAKYGNKCVAARAVFERFRVSYVAVPRECPRMEDRRTEEENDDIEVSDASSSDVGSIEANHDRVRMPH